MAGDRNYIEITNKDRCDNLEELMGIKGISGRLMRRLLKSKQLLVNDNPANRNQKLCYGDIVKIMIEDEDYDVEPQFMDIEILYEDRDVLVLNKPPFLVVHPTKNIADMTLSNGVAYYFKSIGLRRKIRLISRLDRDTSGVIAFAKNSYGHQYMARQMENGVLKKNYVAVVEGSISNNSGMIDLPIGVSEDGIRQEVRGDGLPSITSFEVLERLDGASLVKLELLTGRTHQIRVHLASIGNPIIGDPLYGSVSNKIHRQALHATSIEFESSETGERVQVDAPLPTDIIGLLYQFKSN